MKEACNLGNSSIGPETSKKLGIGANKTRAAKQPEFVCRQSSFGALRGEYFTPSETMDGGDEITYDRDQWGCWKYELCFAPGFPAFRGNGSATSTSRATWWRNSAAPLCWPGRLGVCERRAHLIGGRITHEKLVYSLVIQKAAFWELPMYRDMIDFHDVERQVSSKASMQTHLENQQPEGHERHFYIYIYIITVCM